MTTIVTHPRAIEPLIDPELVALVEHLLVRVKAGVTIGLGMVEHQLGDDVVVEVCGPSSYHHLNSGAARLSHLLAGMKGDEYP